MAGCGDPAADRPVAAPGGVTEEQSLDRLRRWSRELKARDIFAVPEGAQADERLEQCVELLDSYADEVYPAVHAPVGQETANA